MDMDWFSHATLNSLVLTTFIFTVFLWSIFRLPSAKQIYVLAERNYKRISDLESSVANLARMIDEQTREWNEILARFARYEETLKRIEKRLSVRQ